MGIPLSLSQVPDETPYIQYVASPGQTVYPYPFPITQDADLVVVVNGVTQATDSTYLTFGTGNPTGGYIQLNSGSTGGDIITLYRDIAIERLTQIGQNSGYSSTAFNAEYNNIYLILQQLETAQGFSLQLPNTNSPAPTTTLSPASYANKYLAFDANGNPVPAALTSSGSLTGNIIAGLLNVITNLAPIAWLVQFAAETTAGLTGLVLGYPEGDVRRYGVVPNSMGAAANNYNKLKALWNANVTGPTGNFYFPNTTGADTYYIGVSGASCNIVCRDGVHIDGRGCSLVFVGTGSSADTLSGCFTALRDFSLKNATISNTWATGPATSAGQIFQFGTRGTDSPCYATLFPTGLYENALTVPMGNIELENLRLSVAVTGANIASSSIISMIGGLHNVSIKNVTAVGTGTGGVQQGVVYEFGWASNEAAASARQTSHMHNFAMRNVDVLNLDIVAGGAAGVLLAGAWGAWLENVFVDHVSNGIQVDSGECLFFRPSVNIDSVGARRLVTLRNVLAQRVTNTGLFLIGAEAPTGGFMGPAWTPTTVYITGQTVTNGGKMYVATHGGTSAGSGGPTGTGTGIADGGSGLLWNFVSTYSFVDLYDFNVDGFVVDGGAVATGVQTSGGKVTLRHGTVQSCGDGIVATDECTKLIIEQTDVISCQHFGMRLDFGMANVAWSPVRSRKLHVRNNFVAGNSLANTGQFAGISVGANIDSALIENNRIGNDSAYSGGAEATQGSAITVSDAGAVNVLCRANHIGGVAGGGNFAYNFVGSAAQGNTVDKGTGVVTTNGPWLTDLTSTTSPDPGNSGTIATSSLKRARVAPTGNETGIILAAGTDGNQEITVINENNFTLTMAVSGTSHVANGTSCVIAALSSAKFVWDTSTNLWYHQA